MKQVSPKANPKVVPKEDRAQEQLSVAVCQLNSIDDTRKNLEMIFAVLSELESDPPDLICFPENSLYLRLQEGAPIIPVEINGDEIQSLSNWAKRYQTNIHLGSVALTAAATGASSRPGKLFNASVLIRSNGSIEDVYRKIHLFDVDVVGHKPVRESDAFSHGESPSTFEIGGWKFGSTICYDLRFAELFLQYAQAEVDALLIPSAFLVPTGRAHWEVLTRARAIESQAYVLAAAQGGEHRGASGAVRSTWGHSTIVDPWGEVLAMAGENSQGPLILRATLSEARIAQVRAQIPMRKHRRLK